MRLLLVEDDIELRTGLVPPLEQAGFAVDVVGDGEEAEYMGKEIAYDAIVLDLGLPKKPGLEVLHSWRSQSVKTPVLILTARGEWHEKVDGFKAGADDYLSKPFHFEELHVRLMAIVRRSKGVGSQNLEAHDLELDEDTQSVIVAGEAKELTATEFRLLRYFMLNQGKLLSKTHLSEHIYDDAAELDSNVLEVYVNRLRHKIGKKAIKTRRGQGYIFGARNA